MSCAPLLQTVRRLALPSLAILVVSLLVVAGVRLSLYQQLNRMLLDHTEMHAVQFSRFINDQRRERPDIRNTHEAILAVVDDLRALDLPGTIARYRLFDFYGRPIYDSAAAPLRLEPGAEIDETARHVIATGRIRSDVRIEEAEVSQTWTTEAFVPITGAGDRPVAAIQIFFDMTDVYAMFRRGFGMVTDAVTLMALILYAVPAVAFVYQSEKCRDRERAVHELSHFDRLTGLLNRTSAVAELRLRLRQGNAGTVGLLYIDVDHFKTINEEDGQARGDFFLRRLADRLRRVLRSDDVIGRLGSDEFIAILSDTDARRLDIVAERIVQLMRRSVVMDGQQMIRSVSAGAHLLIAGESAEKGIAAAEQACLSAKERGGDRVVVYSDDLEASLHRRRATEAALRSVIRAQSVDLRFQPIIDASSLTVAGFEALARLSLEDGTPISPGEFIPLAEETGMIEDFGRLVLRGALAASKDWPATLFVSVNLSPAQFRSGAICGVVRSELAGAGVSGNRLELEVTESLILAEDAAVGRQLTALRRLGLRIAMDDFGTGYSSLGHLWKYRFDKLKIDRVFLENYAFDKDRQKDIIETIVVLGHRMGMSVVVEGVETADHVAILKRLNADQYQGFHFATPLNAADARAFLGRDGPATGAA